MLGKRIINTATGAGAACTTDTVQILGDTSCVAYYKMNDATDETGSYDGTPTNVNFNVAGKFGNAGDFNGSSSKIDLPNGTGGTGAITVSTWVNTNNISTTQGLWSFGSVPNTASYAVECLIENGYLFFRTLNSAGTAGFQIQTSTGHISNNTWHNIICVFPNTTASNACKIYIDGTERATGTSTLGSITRNTLNNGLGGRFYSGSLSLPLNGKIDQVRIFDRAITANEVTTLYNEVYCQPTIVPTDYFNTVIWDGEAGNGSRDFSGVGFQPDLVWAKRKSSGDDHHIYDSVRGAGSTKVLASNKTAAEPANNAATYGYLDAFLPDGFSTVSGSANNAFFNENNQSFVAWNWKSGGAAVSNTDGTITSQVSANTDAGFSIVKYTGNGAAQTIGHGLSQAPELIITKGLTNPITDWATYSATLGATKYLVLNGTNAAINTSAAAWNNTNPTDTVFSVGSGFSYPSGIAYAFHSVDGMSKFGSYVGTGAAGNSIVTGFRPAFVMIKGAVTPNATNWWIFDNKRNPDNPLGKGLLPNLSNAEQPQGTYLDFNSNGFTWLSGNGEFNDSGNTFIYMAFAEEVFDPNGVTRNATNPFGDNSEVALYKFEDNATDAEGSYNGTASNVTYATGYIDKAAVFNGSSSYIDLGSTIDNPLRTAGAFGVSLWFNANSYGSNAVIFKLLNDIYVYMFLNSSNELECRVSNSSGVASIITTSISLNTWYHVVWTGNSTNGVTLYINGSSVGNTSWNGTFETYTNINYKFNYLGYNGSNIGWFNGTIDQVRIFNKALDAGEVTQLYNE